MSDLFGFVARDGVSAAELDAVAARMAAELTVWPWHRHGWRTVAGAVTGRRLVAGERETEGVVARAGDVTIALAGTLLPDGRTPAPTLSPQSLHEIVASGDAHRLSRLDGEFLLSVWDARSRVLLLVNDRFGLRPHYFVAGPCGLAYAPSVKALLHTPGFHARPDPLAIGQYLRLQQLLDDRTWIEEVRLLPPASVLRYEAASGALSLARYWDWSRVPPPRRVGFRQAVHECVEVFQLAIDRRLEGFRKPGVYLSGGLDSRTILAFIDRPVTTITYGAAACRDVHIAAWLAARHGSRHHWFPLLDGSWVLDYVARHLALTEGMQSWIHAHGMTTLASVHEWLDIVLSGWDGGTILGGSLNFYRDEPFRRAASEEALASAFFDAFCRDFTWPGLTDEEADRVLAGQAAASLRDVARASVAESLARTRHWVPALRADGFYVEQVLRRSLQNQVTLLRSAVATRCPYFDATLVDFLYSLPESVRTSPRFRRAMLARRSPALARVPYEKDLRLPHPNRLLVEGHAIGQRLRQWLGRRGLPAGALPPTRLYADYEHYLRTDLRRWAESLLFDERTLDRGLYDRQALRALWERHLAGRELHTIGKVAPLMAIEMALRYLVDGDAADAACGLASDDRPRN